MAAEVAPAGEGSGGRRSGCRSRGVLAWSPAGCVRAAAPALCAQHCQSLTHTHTRATAHAGMDGWMDGRTDGWTPHGAQPPPLAGAAPVGLCPPVPKQPLQADAAIPAGPAASGFSAAMWASGFDRRTRRRVAGPSRDCSFGGERRDPAPEPLRSSQRGGELGRRGRLPPHPRALRHRPPRAEPRPGAPPPRGQLRWEMWAGSSSGASSEARTVLPLLPSSETGLREALMS